MPQFEQIGLEAVMRTGGFTRGMAIYNNGLKTMDLKTTGAATKMTGIGVAASAAFAGIAVAAAAGAAAVAAAGAAIVGSMALIGKKSLDIAIDVESAFAGVAKTTEGLVDEFGNMTAAGQEVFTQFRDLAKAAPTPIEELLRIGEVAGQLGVAKEALAEFSGVVADLGVATDLTQEEAAIALAQIANIFQISTEEMAINASRAGSAVVDLGNNFATNEPKILAFAQRIAGAGKIAGLSQADIFGIGAAFTSTGIEAAAGGTAVQKVLIAMTEAAADGGGMLDAFAATAGVSSAEFARAFRDDAAGAFDLFVKGLGAAGEDAFGILDALELKDSRLVRAFLSVGQAGDLLTDAMNTSSQAFQENTALAEEAAQRYNTAESKAQTFKNAIRDIGITIGFRLLPHWRDMLGVLAEFVTKAAPKVEAFAEKIIRAFETFGQTLSQGKFGELLGELLGPLGNLAEFSLDTFAAGLGQALDQIAQNINVVSEALLEALPALAEGFGSLELKDSFNQAWQTFLDLAEFAATDVLPALIDFFVLFANAVKENKDLIEGAFQLFADMFETARLAIEFFWNTAGPIFLGLDENAKKFEASFLLIGEVIDSVKNRVVAFGVAVGELFDGLVTFVTELPGQVVDAWDEFWQGIFVTVTDFFESVKSTINEQIEAIKAIWVERWEAVREAAIGVWQAILGAFIEFGESLLGKMGIDGEEFIAKWQNIWEDIGRIFELIWIRITTFFETQISIIRSQIEITVATIRDFWIAQWTAISDFFIGIWEKMTGFISSQAKEVEQKVEGPITSIKSFWEQTWQAISDFFVRTWEAITGFVQSQLDLITGFIQTTLNNIRAFWVDQWNQIKETVLGIFQPILEGVTNFFGKLIDAIATSIGKAIQTVSDTFTEWVDLGRSMIQSIIDGWLENAGDFINSVTDTIGQATDAILDFLEMGSPSKLLMRIGGEAAGSLGQGFAGEAGGVASAISQAMGQIIDPLISQSQLIPQMAGGATSASTTVNNRSFNPTVNLTTQRDVPEDNIRNELTLMNLINEAQG